MPDLSEALVSMTDRLDTYGYKAYLGGHLL